MYRIQEAQLYTQANQHTSHSKGSKLGKFKKCKHWQSSETLLVDKDLIIIEDKSNVAYFEITLSIWCDFTCILNNSCGYWYTFSWNGHLKAPTPSSNPLKL